MTVLYSSEESTGEVSALSANVIIAAFAVKDICSTVADPGFLKGGGGAVHLSRGVWGHAPPENFEFQAF